MPILTYGTDEQLERYLPRLVSGELIGAHAATESEAGSDVFSLRTQAKRVGSDYVLDGRKHLITNAPLADVFLVLATIDRDAGMAGLTAFLVDRDTPGVAVVGPYDTMGLRTSPIGELILDNVRVPADQVLLEPGAGATVFGAAMESERLNVLAPALGRMRRLLDMCLAHARARRQFDRPIGANESVANRMVDMQNRLETGQLLTYRAAWMKDTAKRLTWEPSQVKLVVSESWLRNSLDALQIHGGVGYLREMHIEREVRDATASRIYSGTSEMQRRIIARFMGL